MTTPAWKRHPLRNFFMVKRVQLQFLRGGLVGILTTLLVALALATGGTLWLHGPESLPLLWPAAAIYSLAILATGVGLSLSISRRIALPLFKVRRWAEAVFAGKIDHLVEVRPEDDLPELEVSCNQVARKYCELLRGLRQSLGDASLPPEERIQKAREHFRDLQF